MVGEYRKSENDDICDNEDPAETQTGENAEHAYRQKQADADADRRKENKAVDMRDGFCKHLQIRLGDCYREAEKKADDKYQRQVFRLCQSRADLVAYRSHGNIRAEREEAHAENQHDRAQHKA